jgi:cellulose biosynthesis protein BcsQ
MSRVSIVLVDTDERYLMPLELKFINEFGENGDIVVITEIEYLNEYFSSPKNIDLLIINENLYSSELQKHNIQSIFILKEQLDDQDTGDISVNSIYKYTSVKEIYNEIINNTSKAGLKHEFKEAEATKVIMVYSPVGGVGKTVVSIGLSAALSRAYKKVLYINTETIQSFSLFFDNEKYMNNGFEKYLLDHDEYLLEYLKAAIEKDHFDYLLPFRQASCTLNIEMKDYKYLIELIKKERLYDFIILDTSSDFTMDKSMMMAYSDKNIILTAQDKVSVGKTEKLLLNIDFTDDSKFMFICNKYNEKEKNEIINGELLSKCAMKEYIGMFKQEDINVETLSEDKHFQKLAYVLI